MAKTEKGKEKESEKGKEKESELFRTCSYTTIYISLMIYFAVGRPIEKKRREKNNYFPNFPLFSKTKYPGLIEEK